MEYARIAARHFGTDHHEHYITPGRPGAPDPQGGGALRPALRQLVRPAHLLLRPAGAAGRRDPPAGGRRRRRTVRRQHPLRQATGVRRTTTACPVRCAARSAGAAVATAALLDRLPLLRKGRQLCAPGRRADAGPHANLQPAAQAGAGQGADRGLPGAGGHARPAGASNAPYGRSPKAPASSTACWPTTGATRWPKATCPRCAAPPSWPGVSVGYPFLDQALVDFSLRLPTDYKVKGLKLRWFFKEALRGFLPRRHPRPRRSTGSACRSACGRCAMRR